MEDQGHLKTKRLIDFFSQLFTPGLGRTLLYRFLIISVLPMSFVAYISIQNSVQTITQDQTDKLAAIAKAKHNHLAAYFTSTITNIRLQAELENTVNFLQAMKLALKSSRDKQANKSLLEVTKGHQWAAIEEEYGADFSRFLTTYDYVDILLLDNAGNVLYSIRRDSDLGSNVFTPELELNFFSVTAKKALDTGIPVYSDMHIYAPYHNKVASFIMQAVVNQYGDKLGVLAIHLSQHPIQKIMQESTGLGTSGETYLLGRDLLMRSNSRFSQDKNILLTSVKTNNTQLWQQYLDKKSNNNSEEEIPPDAVNVQDIQLYEGYRGFNVYGAQLAMEFSGVPMMLMAELSEAEALMPMQDLLYRVAFMVVLTFFIVLVFSIFSTRAITQPIIQLTIWARHLSAGHLVKEIIISPNNEIGELNNTFNELVDSFQEVIAVIEALAVGDLTKNIAPRSDDDVLVKTLNQLNNAMQGVVDQAEDIAKGNYDTEILPRSDLDVLGTSLQLMTKNLRSSRKNSERQNWLKSSLADITDILSGDNEIDKLARELSSYFSKTFKAHVAVLFTVDSSNSEPTLIFTGGFAVGGEKNVKRSIKFGESLVGQCAQNQEILVLHDSPDDYLKVNSVLGESTASEVIIAPFITNKTVKGVIEIGGFEQFDSVFIELLRLSSDAIAVAFDFCWNLKHTRKLLATTQQQQTDLAQSNVILKQQTQKLKDSEIELRDQSTALSHINRELTSRGEILERQKKYLENAKKETEEKAIALEEASKYKSEFLANMSHELRTPLNSLLILAGILAENADGNLTADDVESAEVIQESGNNLLNLINEILDLSKVESGQMTLIDDELKISNFTKIFNARFLHMAHKKSIEFKVSIDENLPKHFISDDVKLNQIINNLISNAIKFTDTGTVTLNIHKLCNSDTLAGVDDVIAFTVIDSGIGIAQNKQSAIFEAFQQADGSTSRSYGGTGLGLSIALSFAQLLGGDIQVKSEVGKGSQFSLYLPLNKPSQEQTPPHEEAVNASHTLYFPHHDMPLVDDRAALQDSKKLLLIVEDDPNFAKIVFNECHKQNCQAIVASDGETGLQLISQYMFDGIILDYMLPGMDGGDMLVSIKENPATQHIPVHIVSAMENLEDLRSLGAIDQVKKPISHEKMASIIQSLGGDMPAAIHVLIVEDDPASLYALKRLLNPEGVNINGVGDAQSAFNALQVALYDIMILDLGLPDFSGISLLGKIDDDISISLPKVVIHTGIDLSASEYKQLEKFTDRIVIKSTHSHERLLAELHSFIQPFADTATKATTTNQKSLLPVVNNGKAQETQAEESAGSLNTTIPKDAPTPLQPVSNLKPAQVEANESARNPISADGKVDFKNKSILLVDDDMRNTFALAKVLRKYQLTVRLASSGAQSLSLLKEFDDIELVLMDIMMPEMDGYETIKRIREQAKYEHLTIIAVTANAMPGDDQLCFDAGANEYIPKPVDVNLLAKLLCKHL